MSVSFFINFFFTMSKSLTLPRFDIIFEFYYLISAIFFAKSCLSSLVSFIWTEFANNPPRSLLLKFLKGLKLNFPYLEGVAFWISAFFKIGVAYELEIGDPILGVNSTSGDLIDSHN